MTTTSPPPYCSLPSKRRGTRDATTAAPPPPPIPLVAVNNQCPRHPRIDDDDDDNANGNKKPRQPLLASQSCRSLSSTCSRASRTDHSLDWRIADKTNHLRCASSRPPIVPLSLRTLASGWQQRVQGDSPPPPSLSSLSTFPPRTPPSFFSSPLTAAAVHPSPPPPPPRHKVGGKAAVSNFNNESTAPIHSHAPSQSQSVRGGLVESKLFEKKRLTEVCTILGATNARGVGRERRGNLRGGCMSKLCVQ
jgi:hypothetical protein